jgi:hypothetical protein
MKALICIVLSMVLISKTYSQTETSIKTTTSLKTDVLDNANIIAQKIKTLPPKTEVTVTSYEAGWWTIKIEGMKGYVFKSDLVVNEEMKTLIKLTDSKNPQHPLPKNVFEEYINRYGKPDSKSAYNDGDFHSQTYVWHCAQGKYRSVDFEQNDYGVWKMKSEYESDCIN